MAELKPCPFCGSEAHLAVIAGGLPRPIYYGFCTNGHCQTTMVKRRSKQKAIEAWNKRVEIDPFRRAEDGNS